jgi:hypothetical protein
MLLILVMVRTRYPHMCRPALFIIGPATLVFHFLVTVHFTCSNSLLLVQKIVLHSLFFLKVPFNYTCLASRFFFLAASFLFSCSRFLWGLAWIAFDLVVASLPVLLSLSLSLDFGPGLSNFSLSSLSSSSSSLFCVSDAAQAFVLGPPSGYCSRFYLLTCCDRLWCLLFEFCPCVAILLCARLSD